MFSGDHASTSSVATMAVAPFVVGGVMVPAPVASRILVARICDALLPVTMYEPAAAAFVVAIADVVGMKRASPMVGRLLKGMLRSIWTLLPVRTVIASVPVV